MIAFVTSEKAIELDEDMAPLCGAMLHLGAPCEVVRWDDEKVDWSKYSATVVRSTWDYHTRLPEFLRWVDRVSKITQLQNSPEVLHWNTDKHYLAELANADIAIVPTIFIDSHSDLDELLGAGADLSNVVVKPTVSAGSNDTKLHSGHDDAANHISLLLDRGKTPMVQPYQASIDELGETGLVYMAGEFSHGFRKGALLAGRGAKHNDLYVEETISPRSPSQDERALADEVVNFLINKFGVAPLYARVDVVPGVTGPLLLELEATEPSLFFAVDELAASRFAKICANLI